MSALRPCAAGAGALALTALAACGGGGDAQKVRQTIDTWTGQRSCSVLTDRARRSLVGDTDVASCSSALKQRAGPGQFTIGAVTVNGAAAQAEIRRPSGGNRTVFLVKQRDRWMIDSVSPRSGSGAAGSDTASSTAPAPTTGTTTGASGATANNAVARQQYVDALNALKAASKSWESRTVRDLHAQNLTAARADTARYRTDVNNFDRRVRALPVPAGAERNRSGLEQVNAALIGDLDGAAAARSMGEYARLIQRAGPDASHLGPAATKLAQDLR